VKSALIEARDVMGEILGRSWFEMPADGLAFQDAAERC
jgi:hypothetical protein